MRKWLRAIRAGLRDAREAFWEAYCCEMTEAMPESPLGKILTDIYAEDLKKQLRGD